MPLPTSPDSRCEPDRTAGLGAGSPVRERIVLVGWGAIGRRVAALLREREAPVRVVAVAVRDPARERADLPEGARLIGAPGDLASLDATLVVEAAGRASLRPFAEAALALGLDVAVSSTSALTEAGALEALEALARRTGGRILIPPGALGGIDVLSAASRLGLDSVTHRIAKPPEAWRGTAAEGLCDLAGLAAPTAFFEGSAREAAARFPQNANVAAITALAGVGPDRTRVVLVADPDGGGNVHELHAEGAFGRLALRLENRPLPDNPKSSQTTALNLVRLIENRVASVVI